MCYRWTTPIVRSSWRGKVGRFGRFEKAEFTVVKHENYTFAWSSLISETSDNETGAPCYALADLLCELYVEQFGQIFILSIVKIEIPKLSCFYSICNLFDRIDKLWFTFLFCTTCITTCIFKLFFFNFRTIVSVKYWSDTSMVELSCSV